MPNKKFRIVSRKSPLAMWQAQSVQKQLQQHHPDLNVDIIGVTTTADKFMDKSLASMGGKGMFVKELESAILAGEAEAAVHSMKDVTLDLPDGLELPVIMQREQVNDVLITNSNSTLDDLPDGVRLGTSSLRRQCQLRAYKQGLDLQDIRGNVNTRLEKLDNGDFDALILAAAGLHRLGLQDRITQTVPVDILLPAVGQGAMGIEIRSGDTETLDRITPLNHCDTSLCVQAERRVSQQLFGSCHLPIAVYAKIDTGTITITGLVGRLDGSKVVSHQLQGDTANSLTLADTLAESLLEQGAAEILQELQVL